MADSIKEKVWKKLIDRLNGISYVKEVLEGDRQANLDGKFPAIRVDLNPSTEQWESFPKRRSSQMNVLISGQIDIRERRLNKQIIGDDLDPGILRFEEDILIAIEGSDIRYLDGSDPLVHNYEIEVLDNRTINNALREVIILVSFQLQIFGAEQRTA